MSFTREIVDIYVCHGLGGHGCIVEPQSRCRLLYSLPSKAENINPVEVPTGWALMKGDRFDALLCPTCVTELENLISRAKVALAPTGE